VTFGGDVQGVGFRYTACMVARVFDIKGTVRNMINGTVQVIIEGRPDEIGAFVDALSEHMAGYIRHTEQQTTLATGEFDQFGVTF
jgi:acylphosphatase